MPSGRPGTSAPCWCCPPAPGKRWSLPRWPRTASGPGSGCWCWPTEVNCWTRPLTRSTAPPACGAPWNRPGIPAWTAPCGSRWGASSPWARKSGWPPLPMTGSGPSSSTRPTTPPPAATGRSWTGFPRPKSWGSPPPLTAGICRTWARSLTPWPMSTGSRMPSPRATFAPSWPRPSPCSWT